MKILAAIGMLLLLNGCIAIPVAALVVAKLAHVAYNEAKECELAAGRCQAEE